MASPELAHVRKLQGELTAAIADSSEADRVWHVVGDPGAGKSFFLRAVAEELRHRDLKPILVAPPAAQIDSGGVALIQIGEELNQAFPGQIDLSRLTDPRIHWSEKLSAVSSSIDANAERIVLCCDEPAAWPTGEKMHKHFADHANEVVGIALHRARCRRIVTGSLPSGVTSYSFHTLRPAPEKRDWLADGSTWGTLADAAARVVQSTTSLSECSPLQVRLLVALSQVAPVQVIRSVLRQPPGAVLLAQLLLEHLFADPRHLDLLNVLQDLALVRKPFERRLLDALGTTALSDESFDLMHNCLLFQDGQSYYLHDALKASLANVKKKLKDTRDAHRKLAGYYKELFAGGGDAQKPSQAMEAYHHASEARDPEFVQQFQAFFVDQLDALGRIYSLEKRYPLAAETFRTAHTWAPEDDYAHHYYAYNLDVQGINSDDVGKHYERARELDPENVWWWSRHISFLITLGRNPEARRLWDRAVENFAYRATSQDVFLYENLHLWVARLLLHRGRLDFAREVMEQVPEPIREESLRLRAVWRHLVALEAARSGQSVFPLEIPHEDWWDGPHLCSLRYDDKKLSRWLPGRIDELTDEHVHLTVANPPQRPGDEPGFGMLSFTHAEFNKLSLDLKANKLSAGRFVEIGYYSGRRDPVVRVHPDRKWTGADLPDFGRLDPVRYLRTQGLVR